MPGQYRIIIPRRAFSELKNIAEFIHRTSPQNADAVADMILNAIDSLGTMPNRFKIVGTSRKRGTPIHAMVVRPFNIYYRVDENSKVVHILRIIHGARRQPRRWE